MITAATCGVLYDVGEVEGPSEHQDGLKVRRVDNVRTVAFQVDATVFESEMSEPLGNVRSILHGP
jgi:hypothetical protein